MSRRGHLALFLLVLAASPLGSLGANPAHRRRSGTLGSQSSAEQQGPPERRHQQQDSREQSGKAPKAKPFIGGTEYTFTYNGQIALVGPTAAFSEVLPSASQPEPFLFVGINKEIIPSVVKTTIMAHGPV